MRGRAIYAWLKTVDREPEPILKRPVAQVTARTVSRSRITKQLRLIRTTLKRVDHDLRRLGPLVRAAEQAAKRSTKNPRRKLRLSPARRRTLKLQGSYMGYMRQLKPKQKARVKAVKGEQGVPGGDCGGEEDGEKCVRIELRRSVLRPGIARCTHGGRATSR